MSSGLADNLTGHSESTVKEEEVDSRSRRKTILKNGQESILSAQVGQLKTGQDGKRLVQIHLCCPDDLPNIGIVKKYHEII